MKIKDLTPADYNPRTITDGQLEMLKKSLYEYGDLSGFVFNRQTGNLVGGHQRIKCLPENAKIKSKDLTTISRTGTVAIGTITIDGENYTYREVDWPLEREKSANIAANKHGGDFDEELLAPLLKELSENKTFDLDLTGFDQSAIDDLILSLEPPEVKTIDLPVKHKTVFGDIYKLDQHILIAGKVSKLKEVKALIDIKETIIFFTEPEHCDKIVERWKKLTNKKAKRIST